MSATESTSWREQYQTLIEQIVSNTLQGKISSVEQVYRMLVQTLKPGTGEIFERCLAEQFSTIQQRLDSQSDESRKAKFNRQLRALQTIQNVWQRWQTENQDTEICQQAIAQILSVSSEDRLSTVLSILDPNQSHPFSQKQIQQLIKSLKEAISGSSNPTLIIDLQAIINGLSRGLESLAALEGHLIGWIYEQNQGQLGFENVPGQNSPWAVWAKRLTSFFPQKLCQLQALNQSLTELAKAQEKTDLSVWIELAIILRDLQQGLITWFDKQPYSAQWGKRLSCATLITFAMIWFELSSGLNQAEKLNLNERKQYANGCFQVALQSLRTFTQREDFPLYGGIFASFSGEGLRDTLSYLDEPLKQVENTQEKGRILTLLGYSQRTLGQYERAISFHQEALNIANFAGDYLCEIANLNHLSRLSIAQKNYEQAVSYSQRALILARQKGDRLGEANALTNLGYSEVLAAKQAEEIETEIYETSIERLQQGLKLSQRLDDGIGIDFVRHQTQALCYNSLGIAYLVLEQPKLAVEYLENGIKSANFVGDFYLQGLNFAYLAEAYYQLNNLEKSLYNGCLGMYLLEQIGAKEWRKTAALMSILQGQIGMEDFQSILKQYRAYILPIIGVDGFDYLPNLIEKYKQSI